MVDAMGRVLPKVAAYAEIFFAFSMASSMPPTM
jgi:hypothetical protein